MRRPLEHLKQIHKELQHPLPEEGTGKNKGLVKADRIKALVEYMFPGESADEQARIMAKLGAAQPGADEDEHTPATRERHPHFNISLCLCHINICKSLLLLV